MGQLLPITSYEGKILDGRNRYKACGIAGIEPRIEEYTGDDPLGLIASLNDHRRHDSDTERALVGERMASLMHGGDRKSDEIKSPRGPLKPAVTMARAAELAGTSPSQIKRVRKAKRDGIPELVEMLESGDIAPATADYVSSLPEEEQRKVVSGGVAGVKEAAKKSKQSSASSEASSVPSSSTNHQTTTKTPRKPAIPSKEDIAKDHQRILGNLKAAWAAAPTAIREEFMAWAEKTKISTNA